MPTKGAALRCVSWINHGYSYTSQPCFVGHELPELVESPVVMPGSLSAPNSYPLTDTPQIFESDPARGAFRSPDESLADAVVDVFLEAGEPPGELHECTLGGPCADRLEDGSALLIPLASGFQRFARECIAIRCGRQIDNAQVNSEPPFRIIGVRLLDLADLVEIEGPIAVDQVGCAPQALLDPCFLTWAKGEQDLEPSFYRPDGDNGFVLFGAPGENTLIIGNGTMRFENTLRLTVELALVPRMGIRIRHFGNAANNNLRRQVRELLAYLRIEALLEFVSFETVVFPGKIADIATSGIGGFHCPLESADLIRRGQEFDLSDEVYRFSVSQVQSFSNRIGIGGNLTAPPSHTTGHTAPAVGAGVRVRIRRFGKRQDIYRPSSLCW